MRKAALLLATACTLPNPAFDITTEQSSGGFTASGGSSGDHGDASGATSSGSGSNDPVCGDGRVAVGEACDDGNLAPGDGCNESCEIEKYQAEGPQKNIDQALLLGWEECYAGFYDEDGDSLDLLFAECSKANLMLACRKSGSSTFALLAHAPRVDVFNDTMKSDIPTIANGSGWYFNDDWSWGFAPLGAPIHRATCDIEASEPDLRLCWHTGANTLLAGWRCGATGIMSNDWERVVLHAD